MKRKITALLLVSMMLCSCGMNAADTKAPADTKVQDSNTGESEVTKEQEVTETASLYSEDAIRKRMQDIADVYDGYNEYLTDMMNDETSDRYYLSTMAPGMDAAIAVNMVSETASEGIYIPDDADIMEASFNTEEYNGIKEDGFLSVKSRPFSTFGADVDTASYTLLRSNIMNSFKGDEVLAKKTEEAERVIESGKMDTKLDDIIGHYEWELSYYVPEMDPSAVRIEEIINYFDYDYGEAPESEKFVVKASIAPCPWNKDTHLLRVGIRAREKEMEGGNNIVLLVDTSGSMFDANKLPLAQRAMGILTESFDEDDRISIVTYAGSEEVRADGISGDKHSEITDIINSLEAYGSTNGEGGILMAYDLAEKNFIPNGNNRVILVTDGDLNVGVSSEAGLIELIEEKKESGVFLSCLGFGGGNYKDNKMEALADHGNGNYSYIDCSREAEKVLRDELYQTIVTVAKDVKFQIEFNPLNVKAYRKIGYENREMADQDFSDDTKDGGEVGSGEAVTVLYEIALADSPMEVPKIPSRYAQEEGEDDDEFLNELLNDELLTVNIRYKEPGVDESVLREYPMTKNMIKGTMDDDLLLASCAAEFGMLYRDSPYKGTSSYEDVYNRLCKYSRLMEDASAAELMFMADYLSKCESGESYVPSDAEG